MKTIQVLLVGGRQTPNVIGVLLLHPRRIELVVSKDETDKLGVLLDSLKEIKNLDLPTQEEIIIVDAYDFQYNIKILEHVYERYKDDRIQFNLTGSTKIMAIAAYEVARREKIPSFYVNTAGNQLLWLTEGIESNQQPINIHIKDYFNIFGRKTINKFKFENLSFNKEQAINAAGILGDTSPKSARLLQKFKSYQVKGLIGLKIPLEQFDEHEQLLISSLKEFNAVDIIDNSVIIRSNNDLEFFKGDWLEIFVFSEASNKKDKKGKPIFDNCDISLRIPSGFAEKEIDVACISNAQLIHCSCKTDRDPFKTLYLDEMTSISSMIGGRFCSRIFITNSNFPNDTKRQQFLDQAKQREIVVITGDELSSVGDILAKQAVDPNYRRV